MQHPYYRYRGLRNPHKFSYRKLQYLRPTAARPRYDVVFPYISKNFPDYACHFTEFISKVVTFLKRTKQEELVLLTESVQLLIFRPKDKVQMIRLNPALDYLLQILKQ